MPRILTPDQYRTTPWKNGGGVTQEIARQGDGDRWSWRLSIAGVDRDGPFSHFHGLSRILTVIDGTGIDLQSPQGSQRAHLHQPVAFSGDLDVTGRLLAGPVRDLNLIFDATVVSGQVRVLYGPGRIDPAQGTTGVLCLTGPVAVGGQDVPVEAFAFADGAAILMQADATIVLIELTV